MSSSTIVRAGGEGRTDIGFGIGATPAANSTRAAGAGFGSGPFRIAIGTIGCFSMICVLLTVDGFGASAGEAGVDAGSIAGALARREPAANTAGKAPGVVYGGAAIGASGVRRDAPPLMRSGRVSSRSIGSGVRAVDAPDGTIFGASTSSVADGSVGDTVSRSIAGREGMRGTGASIIGSSSVGGRGGSIVGCEPARARGTSIAGCEPARAGSFGPAGASSVDFSFASSPQSSSSRTGIAPTGTPGFDARARLAGFTGAGVGEGVTAFSACTCVPKSEPDGKVVRPKGGGGFFGPGAGATIERAGGTMASGEERVGGRPATSGFFGLSFSTGVFCGGARSGTAAPTSVAFVEKTGASGDGVGCGNSSMSGGFGDGVGSGEGSMSGGFGDAGIGGTVSGAAGGGAVQPLGSSATFVTMDFDAIGSGDGGTGFATTGAASTGGLGFGGSTFGGAGARGSTFGEGGGGGGGCTFGGAGGGGALGGTTGAGASRGGGAAARAASPTHAATSSRLAA